MDRSTINYRTAELAEVRNGAEREYKPTIVIRSTAGQTKHMSITWEEFERIASILTDHAAPLSAEKETEKYDTLGRNIAEVLHLRLDRASGRYLTSWGTKSAEGLGRTISRIVSEA